MKVIEKFYVISAVGEVNIMKKIGVLTSGGDSPGMNLQSGQSSGKRFFMKWRSMASTMAMKG